MIAAIGSAGPPRAIQVPGDAIARSEPVAKAAAAGTDAATATPAAEMAAAGAPIDGAKVAALRAGIADGSYKIDPQAIAARMIALDLPNAR